MLSKGLIEENKSIIFRMGVFLNPKGGIQFVPIKKFYQDKSVDDLCTEVTSLLPYRIDMEIREITDHVSTQFPNTAFVKLDYSYYGPYPIEYHANDHVVRGYLITQHELTDANDYRWILRRGNIVLLQASSLIWSNLSRRKITHRNLRVMSVLGE